jgi:hypothetical protein
MCSEVCCKRLVLSADVKRCCMIRSFVKDAMYNELGRHLITPSGWYRIATSLERFPEGKRSWWYYTAGIIPRHKVVSAI